MPEAVLEPQSARFPINAQSVHEACLGSYIECSLELTAMYNGLVEEKTPTPKPRTTRPPIMIRLSWSVITCKTVPTMATIALTRNAPLRPKKSFNGAALKDPTSSPTLIMELMMERSDDGSSYVPSGFCRPKCRMNVGMAWIPEKYTPVLFFSQFCIASG